MHNHWSQSLESLIDWIIIHDTLSDAAVLRRLMDVLNHAPHPHLLDGLDRPDTATAEQLLAVGAADALALRLIGADSGFFASRGAAGEYLVSVVLPGRPVETTAAGSTLARATVCALALTLSRPEVAEFAPDHGYPARHAMASAGATLH